jgi:predicted CxxxxCH...CXXCH cytochrome family protein
MYPLKIYRVRSNDATVITVDGAINPAYAGVGQSYAIRYGKMVNLAVQGPAGGTAPVRFLNSIGPASFATSTASPNGICQVCHTQTSSFTSSGLLEGPGHPANKVGSNCMTCHKHAAGFKADCLDCHGAPPLTNLQGPGGLASYQVGTPGTGSTTPGAHGKHAESLGYACETCHTGYVMPDETNRAVDIGFSVFSRAGGSYDGQTTVTYAGQNGTWVSRNGSKTCTNIACHGSTMMPNGGADTTPVWDDPATAACGACHGATAAAPPLRGSHLKHTQAQLAGYGYECSLCHVNPSVEPGHHVNDLSEVRFAADAKTVGGQYSGSEAMLDAYGACSNIYCHSTVQSSPPGGPPSYRTTPLWGQNDSLVCSSCHYYAGSNPPLATGSHAKHFDYAVNRECRPCHNYNGSSDPCLACHDPDLIEPQRDRHADHRVDISFDPVYGGLYSGTPEPGDAYGACASTYCHGNYPGSGLKATPVWGNATSGACGTCHGGSNTVVPNSGSHLIHAGGDAHNYACTLCHKNVLGGAGPALYSIASLTRHVNGYVEWQFDASDPRVAAATLYSIPSGSQVPSDGVTPRTYGSCSNTYCHSISQTATGGPLTGLPGEYATTPLWGMSSGSYFCGPCHKNGSHHNSGKPASMDSGSHAKHLSYRFNTLANTNGPSMKCAICHKYDTLAGFNTCDACHGFYSLMALYNGHVNGIVDVVIESVFGAASYNDTSATPGAPGNGYFSCSNTYCHSNGTSVATSVVTANTSSAWGAAGPLSCSSCHGSEPGNDGTGRPWYTNGSPKANSHASASHIGAACSACHLATTTTGTTIASTSIHVNKAYDVTPDLASGISFTYSYAPIGGTCTNVSCHSGSAARTWGQ